MNNLETLIKKRDKLIDDIAKTEHKLNSYRKKLKGYEKDISFAKGEAFNDVLKMASISDDESLKLRRIVSKNPDILRQILLKEDTKIIEGEEEKEDEDEES